jgi:methylmalonyl-CoA mutase N-terminal domain/subunit
MATLKIRDWADEFRIEIIGRFAGSSTTEAANEWQRALGEASQRRVVIDITRLSGYDAAGRQILAHMHKHGTTIAAGTPLSLVFLHEITHSSKVDPGLVLKPVADKKSLDSAPPRFRARAAGE